MGPAIPSWATEPLSEEIPIKPSDPTTASVAGVDQAVSDGGSILSNWLTVASQMEPKLRECPGRNQEDSWCGRRTGIVGWS